MHSAGQACSRVCAASFSSAGAAEMAVKIVGDGSNALRVATMVVTGLHCSRLTCIGHRSMHSFARLCSCCMLGRFFDEERTTCCVMLLMCGVVQPVSAAH